MLHRIVIQLSVASWPEARCTFMKHAVKLPRGHTEGPHPQQSNVIHANWISISNIHSLTSLALKSALAGGAGALLRRFPLSAAPCGPNVCYLSTAAPPAIKCNTFELGINIKHTTLLSTHKTELIRCNLHLSNL